MISLSSIFHFAGEEQPFSPDPDVSGPSLSQEELEAQEENDF